MFGKSGPKTGPRGRGRSVGTVSRRARMRSRAYFNTLSRIRKSCPLVRRDEMCYSSTVCRESSRGCPLSPDAAPSVGGGCCRAVRDCAKRLPLMSQREVREAHIVGAAQGPAPIFIYIYYLYFMEVRRYIPQDRRGCAEGQSGDHCAAGVVGGRERGEGRTDRHG